MSGRFGWVFTACLAWATGCGPAQGEQMPERADPDVYASSVQPYTATACATLDCHGDPGRPLRMYSELGLRSEAALRQTPIDEDHPPRAITDAELQDNVTAFSLVDELARGREHLALLKPLDAGVDHVGGVLWPDRDHPGYQCLRGWLAPDDGPALDTAQACADALDALQP